jgi:hypothetical protein
MQHLNFLREASDPETRNKFLKTLFRIHHVEENHNQWRASLSLPANDDKNGFIPADPAYLRRLEEEDLVEINSTSNSGTYYSLKIDRDILINEISEIIEIYELTPNDVDPTDIDSGLYK